MRGKASFLSASQGRFLFPPRLHSPQQQQRLRVKRCRAEGARCPQCSLNSLDGISLLWSLPAKLGQQPFFVISRANYDDAAQEASQLHSDRNNQPPILSTANTTQSLGNVRPGHRQLVGLFSLQPPKGSTNSGWPASTIPVRPWTTLCGR